MSVKSVLRSTAAKSIGRKEKFKRVIAVEDVDEFEDVEAIEVDVSRDTGGVGR